MKNEIKTLLTSKVAEQTLKEIWPPESEIEMILFNSILDVWRFQLHLTYDESKRRVELILGRPVSISEWENVIIDCTADDLIHYSPIVGEA
tara:strand:- start:6503 stop:6775 length:273 start_codon:yes stop_codon:yes gene_type:complete